MPFFEATDASARAPRYASLRRRAVSVSEVDAAKTAWYAQRRSYRRQRKCSEFWSERIEADRADLRKLWSSVNVLLCRGSSPHSSPISAEDFCRSFDDKVGKIRAATADADAPSFSRVRTGISLQFFTPFSVNDVVDTICLLPDKCSTADPIPTYALKRISDQIEPCITSLFNRSLASGRFPVSFKVASVTPIMKKPELDPTDAGSYRPISNLYVLSKLLERLVVRQLLAYLSSADLLPPLQSGSRPGHSTETAVLRILSDILSTAVISLLWSFWTCRRHSTPSTMTSSYNALKRALASQAPP